MGDPPLRNDAEQELSGSRIAGADNSCSGVRRIGMKSD